MKTRSRIIELMGYFLCIGMLLAIHLGMNKYRAYQASMLQIVRLPPNETHEALTPISDHNSNPKRRTRTDGHKTATPSNQPSNSAAKRAQKDQKEKKEPKSNVEGDLNSESTEAFASERKIINMISPDQSELEQSGLSSYAARNVIRYIQAGGQIYSKKSLLKIYNMDSSWVDRHEFIYAESKRYISKKEKKVQFPIDINTADSSDFKAIKGIGSFYASRILRFREALGGFVSVDQVRDTYGLPDSTFLMARESMVCDGRVHQLSIADTDIKTLARHPYISYKEAKLLQNYLRAHPESQDSEDLRAIYGISSERLERMLPYLRVGGSLAGVE